MLFLLLSCCTEAAWNICLTKSKGIGDWPVNLIGVTFLVIGIVLFKKALATTSLSVASVIWSGISLVLTILADVYFFKTRLDFRTAFFMLLCLLSTIGLNYYSNKA